MNYFIGSSSSKQVTFINWFDCLTPITKPDLIIKGKSKTQEQTFYNDAARVWNAAPNNIKDCKTIVAVKKHIKTFVKTLPV